MARSSLDAKGLTYGYSHRNPLFVDRDVAIVPATMTALVGPSGTGKSTLLYLLAGLLNPWSGSVRFNGVDLTTLADHQRARTRAKNFGFVFQDFALDSRRSILDAVLEPCMYSGIRREHKLDRAQQLLDQFGVGERPHARPGEISGGQAQRVAVCRALLMEPELIFADEPTGNLDWKSSDVVLSALQRAAEEDGVTVLIATHDDRVVKRCTGLVDLG